MWKVELASQVQISAEAVEVSFCINIFGKAGIHHNAPVTG